MGKRENRLAHDEKPVKKHKRKVQSTQQNVPVSDFIDGIIITKNGDYVKIIEVLPAPFFFKKVSDQNTVARAFQGLLKIAPGKIHIKSIAMNADLTNQIRRLDENIQKERNDNCRRIGKEYEGRLYYAQNYGITRRFFISVSYERTGGFRDNASFDEIRYQLESMADKIRSTLKACGNEVIAYMSREEENRANMKLFYFLYNRRTYYEKPFEDHAEEVWGKYYKKIRRTGFYLPPAELIAGKSISYRNRRYIVSDGLYYTFLYIPENGYNSVVVTGWLDGFVNSYNGVDVDIFLERKNKTIVKRELDHVLATSQVTMGDTNSFSDAYETASSVVQSGYYIKNGIAARQDVYDMGILITVSGETIKDVEMKTDALISYGKQIDVTLRPLLFQEEEGFTSALPLVDLDSAIAKKMMRNVLTNGAAACYPFTTFQMIHDTGLYIADDLMTGSPVIPDVFKRDIFTNPHMFICGKTGAGKTVSILTIAVRARVLHIPVFIISPEKQDELRRLCEEIGGQFVDFGQGSSDRMNIMDVHPISDEIREKFAMIDGYREESSYLEATVGTVLEFLEIHYPHLKMEEKQLLNEAIIETYRRKGITSENESVWKDKTNGVLKEMPVLSDLANVLAENKETVALSRIVKFLTQGAGAHFDGQTNIDINNEFIIIGLENNSKTMLDLSMYSAMEFIWEKVKQDRTQNKMFIIDEWWKMARNRIAMEKSIAYSKLARALGCSMIFATQQMDDIFGEGSNEGGKAVLNNCDTKIVLGMTEDDVKAVKDLIDLTSDEMRSIKQFSPGQALFLAGTNRMSIQFTPSETEKLLMFTDQETINRYDQIKREKERQARSEERRKQERENPFDFNDVFEESEDIHDASIFISSDELLEEFSEEDVL